MPTGLLLEPKKNVGLFGRLSVEAAGSGRPAEAGIRAGLVLAGGLFQALLVAASWTFRRGARERMAVADSYRILADYAAGLARGRSRAAPPVASAAGTTLDDANLLLPTAPINAPWPTPSFLPTFPNHPVLKRAARLKVVSPLSWSKLQPKPSRRWHQPEA
jgi:hypothetical protein